jgi:hypothetical protein
MIEAGYCWPLTVEPIALGERFVVWRQKPQVQPRAKSNSEFVSQNISQGSRIPRGDIETQEGAKVAKDSLRGRMNKRENCNEPEEGCQAR